MVAEWYYSEAGQSQGPVSALALREMVATGDIKPETLVWKDGLSEWVPARKLKGLFPVDVPPPPPPIQEGSALHEVTFHDKEREKELSRTHDSKFCHECGAAINIKAVVCPKCGVAQHSDPENGLRPNDPRRGCQATLLISAISNIIVGLIWVCTCFGAIFAIPMFILCGFEFRLWSQIEDLPINEVGARSHSLAIAEIVVGLVNTPTLICGIINLIRSKKMIERPY